MHFPSDSDPRLVTFDRETMHELSERLTLVCEASLAVSKCQADCNKGAEALLVRFDGSPSDEEKQSGEPQSLTVRTKDGTLTAFGLAVHSIWPLCPIGSGLSKIVPQSSTEVF